MNRSDYKVDIIDSYGFEDTIYICQATTAEFDAAMKKYAGQIRYVRKVTTTTPKER